MGSREYLDRAAAAARPRDALRAGRPWYAEPGLVDAAGRARARRAGAAGGAGRAARVIFTAHSLPERVRAAGDTYPEQLAESAPAGGRGRRGRPTGGWRGRAPAARPNPGSAPTCATSRAGWRRRAADAVVVCPIGFVADHLEVLYDLDIEARPRWRPRAASAYARTASLNDDPAFVAVLADVISPPARTERG